MKHIFKITTPRPPNIYFHCSNICHHLDELMRFNALFVVLHYFQALNSGSHFPGILFPGNMVIPTVLPLTVARRSVNVPEVRHANTHPARPLHGGSFILSTLSHYSIKLLESWTKQSPARLDHLSSPLAIVASPALRVAGFHPRCQTSLCSHSHWQPLQSCQFAVAEPTQTSHPGRTCKLHLVKAQSTHVQLNLNSNWMQLQK